MSQATIEEKEAIDMAQALLGSMAQQPNALPPPVQANPPLLRRLNKPSRPPRFLQATFPGKHSPPPKSLMTTSMKSKTTPLCPLHPSRKLNLLTLPPPATDYCNDCCGHYQSHRQHSSMR